MNLIALENKIEAAAIDALAEFGMMKNREVGGFYLGAKSENEQESFNAPSPQIHADRLEFDDREKTSRYYVTIGFLDKTEADFNRHQMSMIQVDMIDLYRRFKKKLEDLFLDEEIQTVERVRFYRQVLQNGMSGVITTVAIEASNDC